MSFECSSIPVRESLKICFLCDKLIYGFIIEKKLRYNKIYFHNFCYEKIQQNINRVYCF